MTISLDTTDFERVDYAALLQRLQSEYAAGNR